EFNFDFDTEEADVSLTPAKDNELVEQKADNADDFDPDMEMGALDLSALDQELESFDQEMEGLDQQIDEVKSDEVSVADEEQDLADFELDLDLEDEDEDAAQLESKEPETPSVA